LLSFVLAASSLAPALACRIGRAGDIAIGDIHHLRSETQSIIRAGRFREHVVDLHAGCGG